jgi:hypothetical protein
MSPEEMKAMMPRIMEECTCKKCPTYYDCGESIGYCAHPIGKSKCIEDEMACICKACPIYPVMGLTEWFFCTRDSERAQTGG